MDTNSYLVETKKDLYKIIKENFEELFTSNYGKNDECFDLKNKKVITKFKEELNGITLEEYCGLRSIWYYYKFEKQEEINNPVRCKESRRALLVKQLRWKTLKMSL